MRVAVAGLQLRKPGQPVIILEAGAAETGMETWTPVNWLFHCHMLVHMMARESLRPGLTAEAGSHAGAPHDSAGRRGSCSVC